MKDMPDTPIARKVCSSLSHATLVLLPVLALVGPVVALAGGEEAATPDSAPAPAAVRKAGPRWSFSLLPKAFQQHPGVDFNVITEMTEAGRRAPQPTAESPAYYEMYFNQARALGASSSGGSKAPNPEYLQDAVRQGLARHHLLGAEAAGRPPSLLVVCHWGEHVLDDFADDISGGVVSADIWRKELLERARVIGGEIFAMEFEAALAEEALQSFLMAGPRSPAAGFKSVYGDLMMPSVWNPLERFMQRSDRNRHLVNEVARGCYFVIVSAYDRKLAGEGKRLLLWRTKMTVNSDSVSMQETLIPLVANTSDYLATDMSGAAVVVSRIDRQGRVDFGPAEVLYWKESPEPAGAKAPAAGGTPATE